MFQQKKDQILQHDPDELLFGVCGTCKTRIEQPRHQARRSDLISRMDAIEGQWLDCVFVECPFCKEASPTKTGPRVYLMRKTT